MTTEKISISLDDEASKSLSELETTTKFNRSRILQDLLKLFGLAYVEHNKPPTLQPQPHPAKEAHIPENQIWDGTCWSLKNAPRPVFDDGTMSEEDRRIQTLRQKKRDALPLEQRGQYMNYISPDDVPL